MMTSRANIPRWAATAFIASAVLTPGLVSSASAQAQPIREGGSYSANARVSSSETGVSFAIPVGFSGQMDPETGLFLILGADMRVAVWAYSEGSPQDVADVMAVDLEELGFVLTEDEIVTASAERLSGFFDVFVEGRLGRLYGSAVRGEDGGAIGVVALGEGGVDEQLEAVVESVVSSVEWAVPEARAWAAEVAGTVLQGGNSSSDYSPDDDGDFGSSASQTDVRIGLCSDGSYAYSSESQTFFSTSDASASSESKDAHNGVWSLVADIRGNAWLVLEPVDREEIVYRAELIDGAAVLGGRRYSITDGGC